MRGVGWVYIFGTERDRAECIYSRDTDVCGRVRTGHYLTTLTEKLLRRAERMSTRRAGKQRHSTHRKYSA
jgi:hypothetical protein